MIAGIDGCKGGWFVTKSESWPCREAPLLAICANIVSALEFVGDSRMVVIDIPIGIPSGAKVRDCDLEAREMLDQGSTRVFMAPPRETLTAKTADEFQELHLLHRGKKAGYPVWGFLSKLKEVDRVITADLQTRIREFHPELAWGRAAGKLLESKHDTTGLSQRLEILRSSACGLEDVLGWKKKVGKAAAIDDFLDALIGLSVAADALKGKTFRVPHQSTESDARGLSMEIWY